MISATPHISFFLISPVVGKVSEVSCSRTVPKRTQLTQRGSNLVPTVNQFYTLLRAMQDFFFGKEAVKQTKTHNSEEVP